MKSDFTFPVAGVSQKLLNLLCFPKIICAEKGCGFLIYLKCFGATSLKTGQVHLPPSLAEFLQFGLTVQTADFQLDQ